MIITQLCVMYQQCRFWQSYDDHLFSERRSYGKALVMSGHAVKLGCKYCTPTKLAFNTFQCTEKRGEQTHRHIKARNDTNNSFLVINLNSSVFSLMFTSTNFYSANKKKMAGEKKKLHSKKHNESCKMGPSS